MKQLVLLVEQNMNVFFLEEQNNLKNLQIFPQLIKS